MSEAIRKFFIEWLFDISEFVLNIVNTSMFIFDFSIWENKSKSQEIVIWVFPENSIKIFFTKSWILLTKISYICYQECLLSEFKGNWRKSIILLTWFCGRWSFSYCSRRLLSRRFFFLRFLSLRLILIDRMSDSTLL